MGTSMINRRRMKGCLYINNRLVGGLLVASLACARLGFAPAAGAGRSLALRRLSPEVARGDQAAVRVAVLISGQCHRFIYKDQHGPLFAHDDDDDDPANPALLVDVYVALQCGRPHPALLGSVDAPPYMRGLPKISDIENWYRQRGANSVTVKIVNDETLDRMEQEITEQATTLFGSNEEGFDLKRMVVEMKPKPGRWVAEVRKLLLRHTVYLMSQQKQPQDFYSGYVYMREDNYFLTPLDIGKVLVSNNAAADKPLVVVEEGCSFGGSYSDKFYVANEAGASALFAATHAEFVERMKRFVLFTYYRKDTHRQPMQPESFVQDTLSTVRVEHYAMKRTDVRYRGETRCVKNLYFSCMSAENQQLAHQHGLHRCEDLEKEEEEEAAGKQ